MPEATFRVGDTFELQFVWRSPEGDFLRALFEAEVKKVDSLSNKYVVLLRRFVAGRQESSTGETRAGDELYRQHWALVNQLTGRRVSLAYEADDGRPLWLRWETLTGEHNFFSRLDELPKQLYQKKAGEKEAGSAGARKDGATDSSVLGSPDHTRS